MATAISISDLEETAALGWQAADEAPLGRWRLRAAEGFTGRANSALAIGDPGMPLAATIAEVLPVVCRPRNNAPARRLYARTGFAAHHEYHYRVAG